MNSLVFEKNDKNVIPNFCGGDIIYIKSFKNTSTGYYTGYYIFSSIDIDENEVDLYDGAFQLISLKDGDPFALNEKFYYSICHYGDERLTLEVEIEKRNKAIFDVLNNCLEWEYIGPCEIKLKVK